MVVKPRILLAEDDNSITEVLILLLGSDYEVIIPNNFTELQKAALDLNYDLLLLDISLWGHDYNDFIKKLRMAHSEKIKPLILLSARSNIKEIAAQIKADAIVEKPFEIDKLINTINKNLHLASD